MNQVIKLKEKAPETTATYLISQQRSWLEERLDVNYELMGYKITGKPTREQLQGLKAQIEEISKPLSEERITMALLQLKAITKERPMSSNESSLQIDTLVELLSAYPADAVLKGIQFCANTCKFFPAWSEIKDEVYWYSKNRVAALGAINAKLDAMQ
jgi:hypothetical protein